MRRGAALAFLLLIAAEACYDESRGGCWDRGFVDYLPDVALCQAACEFRAECNYFSYHVDRGNRRCHLCRSERDTTLCGRDEACVWGPETCPGDEEDAPATLLTEAVGVATRLCAGAPQADDDNLEAALALHAVSNEWREGVHDADVAFLAALEPVAAAAAAAVRDHGCPRANVCDHGTVLVSTLRAFLLLYDKAADRAFADDQGRRDLFANHRVYLADGGFFNAASVAAIDEFFADVPAHLMAGVRYESPFATLTARDAFRSGCGVDNPGSSLLVVTPRAFNIFAIQYDTRVEDAFGGTSEWLVGDLTLTVLRHEVSHQFDRTMSPRQRALRNAIKARCDSDEDWLRAGVNSWADGANAFFQRAPQEIIASQFGNQYMLSSSTQFRAARSQAARGNLLPMAWFLFNVDLSASGDEATFYERERIGVVNPVPVSLARGGDASVEAMTIPGCGTWTFSYDSDGVATGFDGPSCVCVPDATAAAPTPLPSAPTPRPSATPTTTRPTRTRRPTAEPSLDYYAPTPDPTAFYAPTPEPSPEPTAFDAPTPKPAGAAPTPRCPGGDSPSWRKRGGPDWKDCLWVSEWAPRCDVRGEDFSLAEEACPCACPAAATASPLVLADATVCGGAAEALEVSAGGAARLAGLAAGVAFVAAW